MTRLAGTADIAATFDPPPARTVATRIALATSVLVAVGAAGSRGLPLPSSTDLYDRTVRAVDDAPSWIGHGFELVSELGLVLLAGSLLFAGWRRRRRVPHIARVVAAGSGVVVAYAISEALKVAVAQPRPCLDLAPGTTVAPCPSAIDWSLPSNHATIAMGLAVALALTVRRSARWAVPLALAVAASRTIIGVHYPHDVGSGVLLAVTVVTVTTLALDRPVGVVIRHVAWRRVTPGGDTGVPENGGNGSCGPT